MKTKNTYIKKLLKYESAWKGHGLFAMKLVETLNPDVIVDLGVDFGFSTFCFGYPKIGKVYGIDWFQGDEHAGQRDTLIHVDNLYKELTISFDVSNIEFIKSDFTDASKKWNTRINILHIDGFHSYEAVKTDYENWISYCDENSVILFHDTMSFPETVGKFFNELQGYKINRTNSAGLGILTRSKIVYDKVKKIKNEGLYFGLISRW